MKNLGCMLASLVLGACSALFSENVEGTRAEILIEGSDCDVPSFTISAENSEAAIGSALVGFAWTIEQNDQVLVSMQGAHATPIETTSHLLGGTMGAFALRPSLFSGPQLLRVNISSANDVNQVSQSGFAVQAGENYELSYFVVSAAEGTIGMQLIEEGQNLGSLAPEQVLETSSTPARAFASFSPTRSADNARLLLDFRQVGAYWLDDVQLGPSGQEQMLENVSFDVELAPWESDFEGAGQAKVDVAPEFLTDIAETVIELVVTDSLGESSEAARATIDGNKCQEPPST